MKKYYEELKIQMLFFVTTDVITTSTSTTPEWYESEDDGDVAKIPSWW